MGRPHNHINDSRSSIKRNGLIFPVNEDQLAEVLSEYLDPSENNLILVDRNTERYCMPVLSGNIKGLKAGNIIEIGDGEESKNVQNLHHIWKRMQDAGTGRNSRFIILGGGVLTDIGGFAASTYMRGIPFINVPTTLMGMVDAAIGGKTAINIDDVKNQAGTFALPEAVIIFPAFLKTLVWEELLSGYAEMVKTAVVFDRELYADLENIIPDEDQKNDFISNITTGLLKKIVEIKKEVSSMDFYDRDIRQCLNFGHSIAHALEALYLRRGEALHHGYAVAAGMICEAYISEKLMHLPVDELKKLESYLCKSFPGVKINPEDVSRVISFIKHDKKNIGQEIKMSLLSSIGSCQYAISCPDSLISESLHRYIQLS